jgi:hypothetical protein
MGVLSVSTPLFLEDENIFQKNSLRGTNYIAILKSTTEADFWVASLKIV